MSEWLLCDYGQVLSEAPPGDEWEALEDLASSPTNQHDFTAVYWRHRPGYDRGDVTAVEYWTRVIGAEPAPARLADLIAIDTAMWLHLDRAAVSAAARVAERGIRLALFSNAPIEVAAGIDALPELQAFEPRFFSCRLRVVKPEMEAYEKVLSALGAEPQDVVFFDDRPDNVAAAATLGIRAAVFESPAQFDAVGA